METRIQKNVSLNHHHAKLIPKKNSHKHHFFCRRGLGEKEINLVKKYGLSEDYNAYLKDAIRDDLLLLQKVSLEQMLATFAKQKREIQEKIAELDSPNFNKWESWCSEDNNRNKILPVNKEEQLGIWLLRYAARGDFVSVYYLLQAGAPVRFFSPNSKFHMTSWRSDLHKDHCGNESAFNAAAYYGSLACTKLLYNYQKAKLLTPFPKDGDLYLPMHYAAKCMNPRYVLNTKLIDFYIENKIEINAKGRNGTTVLHHAISEYPLHVMMLHSTSQKEKMSPERRDILIRQSKTKLFTELNISAIDEKTWERSFNTIDTLIDSGADLYALDNKNKLAIDYACQRKLPTERDSHYNFMTNTKGRSEMIKFTNLCYEKLTQHLTQKMENRSNRQENFESDNLRDNFTRLLRA